LPLIRPARATPSRQYFTFDYTGQVASALQPFFEDNIDVAFIDIGHSKLDYKLVVVPADYLMDSASAEALRSYVRDGRHGDHGPLFRPRWMRTTSGSTRRCPGG